MENAFKKDMIIAAIASGELDDLQSIVDYKDETVMDKINKMGFINYMRWWKEQNDVVSRRIKASINDPFILCFKAVCTTRNKDIPNRITGDEEYSPAKFDGSNQHVPLLNNNNTQTNKDL